MIEVNLLPGGRKSSRMPKLSFSLPKFGGGMPRVDPWIGAAAAAVLLFLAGSGWLYASVAGEAEELEVQIEAAERRAQELQNIIERSTALQARRDSIASRVSIVQEIDGARYVWPRLMDEVSRALPDYTWLNRLVQLSGGAQPVFQIEGMTGTYFALTTFMENLEASPFIRGVRLLGSDQASVSTEDGVDQLVYRFSIEATRREPPTELVETIPLFDTSSAPPSAGGGGG